MNRATIQARRDALNAQCEQAQQQHTQLQGAIHLLEHNISGMQGGLQELDALLALAKVEPEEERAQAGSVADDRGNRAVARAWVRARAWWEGWRGR